MLKKILKILFNKHEYEIGSEKYLRVKSSMSLKSKDRIFFSTFYNDNFKEMIYDLKYKNLKYVANSFAHMIKKDVDYVINLKKIDKIIVMPMSPNRKKERLFNQVEEIVKCMEYSYINVKKIKSSDKMSKIKEKHMKFLNIHDSFDVKGHNLDNLSLLIFDDIVTTGNSIFELERALKKEYKNLEIYFYAIAVSRKIMYNNRN